MGAGHALKAGESPQSGSSGVHSRKLLNAQPQQILKWYGWAPCWSVIFSTVIPPTFQDKGLFKCLMDPSGFYTVPWVDIWLAYGCYFLSSSFLWSLTTASQCHNPYDHHHPLIFPDVGAIVQAYTSPSSMPLPTHCTWVMLQHGGGDDHCT